MAEPDSRSPHDTAPTDWADAATERRGDSNPSPGLGAGDPLAQAVLRDRVRGQLFGGESSARTIGRFAVERKLGEGGMGVVYAAYDAELDRRVAIKLLQASAVEGSEGRARMQREARAMAKLSHPNVVHVYEVGTHDEHVFVAMELVEGETLRTWCSTTRGWPEVLAMFEQAGRGLAAAHAAGIVHRDFKPDNVLVATDGRARVLDFGLARLHDAPEPATPASKPTSSIAIDRFTVSGALLGTPAYMAPEQFLARAADARTDQFAFCVSLYEALYRRRPFEGDRFERLSAAVLEGRFVEPPATSLVPPAIWAVLRRGLVPDPGQRFASMTELLEALRAAATPPRARRRWIWAVAALGLLPLLAWATFLGFDRTREPTPTPDAPSNSDAAAARALARLGGQEMVDAAAERAIRCDDVCRVERDFIQGLAAAPEVLRTQARVAEERQGDTLVALRLHGVRPESLPGRIGLRNGDRLIAIAGRPLADWSSIDRVFEALATSTVFEFSYERAGEKHTRSVEIVPTIQTVSAPSR